MAGIALEGCVFGSGVQPDENTAVTIYLRSWLHKPNQSTSAHTPQADDNHLAVAALAHKAEFNVEQAIKVLYAPCQNPIKINTKIAYLEMLNKMG
jgi:hypothetical protein